MSDTVHKNTPRDEWTIRKLFRTQYGKEKYWSIRKQSIKLTIKRAKATREDNRHISYVTTQNDRNVLKQSLWATLDTRTDQVMNEPFVWFYERNR